VSVKYMLKNTCHWRRRARRHCGHMLAEIGMGIVCGKSNNHGECERALDERTK